MHWLRGSASRGECAEPAPDLRAFSGPSTGAVVLHRFLLRRRAPAISRSQGTRAVSQGKLSKIGQVGCVEPLLGADTPAFDVAGKINVIVKRLGNPPSRCVCAKALDTPY